MGRSCDFCKRTNQYICDPADHCMLCPAGQRAHKEEKKKPRKEPRYE